jgi:hypothetical protein
MSSPAVILAPAWALAGVAVLAAPQPPQPLPTPFPAARYQTMTLKSPFAVASAATPVATATPDFASQLYVDGVAHLGQTDYVAIKSRDASKPVALFVAVGDSTADGMRVDAIKWSEESGKSTVDVSKAGEKATLQFDEATFKESPGMPVAETGSRFPQLNQPNFSNQGDGNGPPTPFPGRRFPGPRFPIRGNR